MGKSKGNPLQKWPFFDNFFTQKNVSNRLKMKGNCLKRRFSLI